MAADHHGTDEERAVHTNTIVARDAANHSLVDLFGDCELTLGVRPPTMVAPGNCASGAVEAHPVVTAEAPDDSLVGLLEKQDPQRCVPPSEWAAPGGRRVAVIRRLRLVWC